jgi:hypothetical protein
MPALTAVNLHDLIDETSHCRREVEKLYLLKE